jgi:hypothetical protein
MKERFIQQEFAAKSMVLINQANQILAEYTAQGYRLTLRQLYYQFVSRNYLENNQKNYKRLGDVINNGRLCGLIDWNYIEDRGRETVFVPHWDSPADIIDTAAASFRIDKWEDQPWYVEVQVEKQALEGVLIPVCRQLDIGFCANKGYSSSSALYEAGKRLQEKIDLGKDILILYLGDHDPSGIDMTRDVRERLQLFSRNRIKTVRLALNMDQIEQYNPPENFAKTTDSRYFQYTDQFGESSWELDALEPRVLAGLVTAAVEEVRDDGLYNAAIEREREMRATLKQYATDYRKKNGAVHDHLVTPEDEEEYEGEVDEDEE